MESVVLHPFFGLVQMWVTLYCHSRMLLAGIPPSQTLDSRQQHAGMTVVTVTRNKLFLNHALFSKEGSRKAIFASPLF
jgi:hypothetical protein